MNDLLEQDLRLKGHIYFNKVEEGVYFQGQGGGFIIKGDIYPLVSRIISFIDAGYRLQDIRLQLPEKIRPFFDNLIMQLAQNDMLIAREGEMLVTESWLSNKAFKDFFTYLQENATDFVAQFPAWQSQKVAVVGDGHGLKAAVEALALSGLNQLHVVMTQTVSMDEAEIRHALEYYQQQLPGFTFQIEKAEQPNAEQFADFDYVLQCETQLTDETPELVSHHGIVAGVLFGQALVSPVTSVSKSGFRDLVEQVNRVQEQAHVRFPKTGIAMLGSLAALNVIKSFFGIGLAGIRNYVYRISPYLSVSRHPLFPVVTDDDGAQMMEAFQAEFEIPNDRELEKYEQVKLDLAAFFDPISGCLNEAVGDTVKQVPLFHSKIAVRFPASAAVANQSVLCCGLDAPTAGLRAISEALSLRSAKRLGVAPHQVRTTFDKVQWRKMAVASLLAESPDFMQSANAFRINMMHLEDEEMQLILRFLMSCGYQKDALVLHHNTQNTAFVASLPNDTEGVISRIGATAFDAIQACLCATYIKCQFPEITDNFSVAAFDVVALQTVGEADANGAALFRALNAAVCDLPDVEFVEGEPLLASYNIYSGYAKAKEAL